MAFFVSAGALLLVIVFVVDMLNFGEKLGHVFTWIGVAVSGFLLLGGYLEVRRFSSLPYDRAGS